MTHINYLMENTKNPVIEKKRYELNNSYFIFIINYNEMHFNESLYTLINMIPHIRGGDKRRISYKYRFSLEFNQSITKQESSFILTKRNTKMIRKKIHNSSIFYFSYFIRIGLVNRKQFYFIEKLNYKFKLKIAISFLWNIHINMPGFFNTSMLGLVTSSNLIQIYFFFGNLGFCLEFRDLFKIANNWIPNNGINSLLTTLSTLALAQRDIKRSLAYSTMSQLV
ncbi:hypothetical protein ACJX0J_001807 [Zea mays]